MEKWMYIVGGIAALVIFILGMLFGARAYWSVMPRSFLLEKKREIEKELEAARNDFNWAQASAPEKTIELAQTKQAYHIAAEKHYLIRWVLGEHEKQETHE